MVAVSVPKIPYQVPYRVPYRVPLAKMAGFVLERFPMPRKRRLVDPDGTYHLIARGNNKARVFLDQQDYEKYLSLLLEARKRHGFALYHYVLMPNHIHLLLRPNTYEMPKFMHWIHLSYSKYYCLKHRFVEIGRASCRERV